MSFKDQLITIKNNWLILLLLLLLVFILLPGRNIIQSTMDAGSQSMMEKVSYGRSYAPGIAPQPDNFAPQVTERKITKNANLGIAVEKGGFSSAEKKLKDAVTSTGSFLLNENVQVIGDKEDAYHQGSYQIKVDATKYDAVASQLKALGEVTSFNENSLDITGEYTDVTVELAAEKERLKRFQDMYAKATNVADQIQINDRLFDQERRVQYLADALKNKDLQISYSTIDVSLNEKPSDYLNITFVKFSDLIRSLVNSTNSLFQLLFVVFPYAIALLIGWIIYRVIRRMSN